MVTETDRLVVRGPCNVCLTKDNELWLCPRTGKGRCMGCQAKHEVNCGECDIEYGY